LRIATAPGGSSRRDLASSAPSSSEAMVGERAGGRFGVCALRGVGVGVGEEDGQVAMREGARWRERGGLQRLRFSLVAK